MDLFWSIIEFVMMWVFFPLCVWLFVWLYETREDAKLWREHMKRKGTK